MNLLERPQRGEGCPPASRLEGAASPARMTEDLAGHLASCEECRSYVERVRAGKEAFLRERPSDRFLRQLEARKTATHKRPLWVWSLLAPLALGLTAAIALLIVPRGQDAGEVRFKGNRFEAFYLRTGMAAPEVVTSGAQLRAKDTLRFRFTAPDAGELAILDLDSRGEVTVFHPYGRVHGAPVDANSAEPLPGSIELDSTLGPEVFVAVFSKKRLDLASLSAQLRAQNPSGPVKLECGDCLVETVHVRKVP